MRSLYDYVGLAAVGALLWWIVTRGAPKKQDPLVPFTGTNRLIFDEAELPSFIREGIEKLASQGYATRAEAMSASVDLYGRDAGEPSFDASNGLWYPQQFGTFARNGPWGTAQ